MQRYTTPHGIIMSNVSSTRSATGPVYGNADGTRQPVLLDPLPADRDLELPEPLADAVDGLLPEAVDGWLSVLPLPTYRVTGAVRRDTPTEAVETLTVNLSRQSADRIRPEDTLQRDGQRVFVNEGDPRARPPTLASVAQQDAAAAKGDFELGAAAIASRRLSR
ncbi:MAG: hypothetical protein ACT6S0_26000 [Roseateles sp.]|uniref:hypothetical protein n=1 Tax=Roseateles sp. TaxID=1971397 RepID=UPI004035CB4B